MPDEFAYLKPTVELLQKRAEANGQQLQSSFVLRLENYLLRRGTRSLSDETKTKIVEMVGTETIEQAGRSGGRGRLGGVDVEAYLKRRCPSPFLLCYQAARVVVEEQGTEEELTIMNKLDLGGS